MSFLSGYLLGRASNNNSNPGDAGVGMVLLVGLIFGILSVIWGAASLLMPLVAPIKMAVFLSSDGWPTAIVILAGALGLAFVVSLYCLALCGGRKQFIGAFLILAAMSMLAVFDIKICTNCAAGQFLEITKSVNEKNLWPPLVVLWETPYFIVALLFACLFSARYLMRRFVSLAKRETLLQRVIRPYQWIVTSKLVAVPLLGIALLRAAETWQRFNWKFAYIERVMSNTDKSYDEAFKFAFRGEHQFEFMLGGAIAWTLVALLLAGHIARLLYKSMRKHRSTEVVL